MGDDNILTRMFKRCINTPRSDMNVPDKDCDVITNLTNSIREIVDIVSSDVYQDELPTVDDLKEVVCGKHNLAMFENQRTIRRKFMDAKHSCKTLISEHADNIMHCNIPGIWYKVETSRGSVGVISIFTLGDVNYVKERGLVRTPRTWIMYACDWEDREHDIDRVPEKHKIVINFDASTCVERGWGTLEHNVVGDNILKYFGGEL